MWRYTKTMSGICEVFPKFCPSPRCCQILLKKYPKKGVTNPGFYGIIDIYAPGKDKPDLPAAIEKRNSMTSYEIRRRAARRRRYLVLIVLLLIVLIFAVTKIISRAKDPDAIQTSQNSLPDDPHADIIEPSASTAAPDTSAEETYVVVTEAPVPEETGPRSSANGTLYTVRSHVYVRVNHSQTIPLSLAGGVSSDEVTWTVSDPDVADITPDGMVTGLERGNCTVTASYQDESITIPVTVRELSVINGCTYVDNILVVNKTYSLPSDYDPGILPVTQAAFDELCAAAAEQGLNIYQGSGYRDYDFQRKVYNSMVNGYSKEYADTWSARPGHSEHQTGYTIDCNTIDNEGFANTAEGRWLAEHCHEYGFIVRFPKGKEEITGYSYESWHIRYVGKEHAAAIYQQGLTLEEYLDVDSRYADEETE